MYKLIIIDDEAYILNQLTTLLDWKKLGFKITSTFEDSREVFSYLQNNKVDVILSDISMPSPNGLDIAEYCFKNFPNIAVVLVSGYRDFDYAHQAIKYNVFDYITKPISYENFYNCMQSLANKLNAHRMEKLSHFRSHSSSSMQEVFFHLLYGSNTTISKLTNALTNFKLNEDIISMPCALLSISIENFEEFTSQNPNYDITGIYNAIYSLIPLENDNSYNIPIRYSYNTLEVLTIKKQNDFSNHFVDEISIIRNNLGDILKLNTSIEITKIYTSLSDLATQNTDFAPSSAMSGDELIKKVMEYIENNYKKPITLEDISRYVTMSKGYFCSQYKILTNESFITTLNKYRIERAKELLKDQGLKPSTVGQFVGYQSTQHFYRVFKSLTGYTPNDYKERGAMSEHMDS